MMNRKGNRPDLQPVAKAIGVALAGQLIVLALLILLNPHVAIAANRTATPLAAQITAADCSTVTAVPQAECVALARLFTETQGISWISNTDWLAFDSADAPCDWYGVSCAGGHVTELALPANHLSGTLPLALGDLSGLTRLRLENNALHGRVPPTLCRLATSLTDTSLAYNALFTQRASVEECLNTLEGDWAATQTVPVADLRISEFFTDTLRLAWTPIAYTEDGGGYAVLVATSVDGPFTVHGQTPDKDSSTYLITGLEPGRTYYIQVRSTTAPHGAQLNTVWSNPAKIVGVTAALAGRVLVAAYFPADNDLAAEIGYVVERFRHGTALNPNVQVVLLVDGRQNGDTQVLEIAGGQTTMTKVVEQQWGMSELDTADPEVLAWFLRYARGRVPAERTVAALIGHGVPLSPEVDWPSTGVTAARARPAGKIPPLPKEHEASPSDVTNRGYMSAIDVGRALLAATDNGADPFDVVFFDQCFQGNLDVLYEAHRAARVFVASPNYAWLAAAYDKYITQFTPDELPEALAQAIINLYEGTLDQRHPNSIFWVRGKDIAAIAGAVSDLGDALLAALQNGERSKIASAVQSSQYVDTTQCGEQNLQLGPPDELIGIESFGNQLRSNFGAGDPYGVSTALDALQTAMGGVQKRTRSGSPYIAPDEFWDYGNTLTLLAPLPADSPANVAWRASIYRADAPFAATWTLDPSQPISVTASLAYVKEGRWDEFLAEWYDPLTPTVGQWCNYMPPRQVVIDEADTLTLTVALAGSAGAHLAWTPTDDTSALSYWLYSQGPFDVGWKADSEIAIDETAIDLADLDPGAHRFIVLARNGEQEFVAKSNEATVAVPSEEPPPDEPDLFAPIVIHN